MRKTLILILALLIVLSSISMVSAGEVDDSDDKLLSFAFPKTWENREVSHDNNSSKLVAFSSDKSLEFGIDFNTDVDTKNLIEVDNGIYQDGNTIFEIFEMNGDKYRAYVKCSETENSSSLTEILQDANYELFKFNKLNDIRPISLS